MQAGKSSELCHRPVPWGQRHVAKKYCPSEATCNSDARQRNMIPTRLSAERAEPRRARPGVALLSVPAWVAAAARAVMPRRITDLDHSCGVVERHTYRQSV